MTEINISPLQVQIRDRLATIKKAKQIKNSDLRGMLSSIRYDGPSEGSLSELFNNKKAFSSDFLNSLMANMNSTFSNKEAVIREIRQFEIIQRIANSCKVNMDFRLIVGNTGIGKSIALRTIADETTEFFYFKADRQMSWFSFLLRLSKSLGMTTDKIEKLSQYKLYDEIEKFLMDNAANRPVLVLDEMERLPVHNWLKFKDMATSWEGSVGIMISAITSSKKDLASKAKLDANTWMPTKPDSNQYTTLARRFKVFDIPAISPEDVSTFFMARGVTDQDVLKCAEDTVWNYDQAEKLLQKAVATGFDLENMNLDEFKIIKVH